MNRFTTRQLVIDAMLCAMCAVLGYVSLDAWSFKFTFESLPILLGALLFGPVDGLTIGAVGTLIYQMLRYGFSATTLLWILPYLVIGLVVGLYARHRYFHFGIIELLLTVTVAKLLVTILNTGVIYIDSKYYGWYYPTLITGSLVIRLVCCIIESILFGLVLHPVLYAVRTVLADRESVPPAAN